MRVGLFDSGVGGLTVLKQFLKYHPNNEYFYYGDTSSYNSTSHSSFFAIRSKRSEDKKWYIMGRI